MIDLYSTRASRNWNRLLKDPATKFPCVVGPYARARQARKIANELQGIHDHLLFDTGHLDEDNNFVPDVIGGPTNKRAVGGYIRIRVKANHTTANQ